MGLARLLRGGLRARLRTTEAARGQAMQGFVEYIARHVILKTARKSPWSLFVLSLIKFTQQIHHCNVHFLFLPPPSPSLAPRYHSVSVGLPILGMFPRFIHIFALISTSVQAL